MRLILHSLIALAAVFGLGAMLLHNRAQDTRAADVAFVQQSLTRLHERTSYHAALKAAAADNPRNALLVAVRPEWFGEELPVNILLEDPHPWIDLAPPGDNAPHPPDPVIRRGDQAGFWYNPTLGIFRARVPQQATERQTLELYNSLNTAELAELPLIADPLRAPLAYRPGITPGTAHASPVYRPADPSAETYQVSDSSSVSAKPTAKPGFFDSDPLPELEPKQTRPTPADESSQSQPKFEPEPERAPARRTLPKKAPTH
ncbi:MAG: hypothetical protein AAF797_09600 [Planctomycetota bacterium]